MSNSGQKELLLGVSEKKGKYVGRALVDPERFDSLYEQIKQILTEIGDSIYAGIADSKPIEYGGNDPCRYCKVKPICRKNNKGTEE